MLTIDELEMSGHGCFATLNDAVEWVRGELAARNRVLVRVCVDGETLTGENLRDQRGCDTASKRIACQSESRYEISCRSLGKLAALVAYLHEQHTVVADRLCAGDVETGMQQFGGILDAWRQVHDAYRNLIKLLDLPLEQLRAGDIPALRLVHAFLEQLRELALAVKDQDHVLLADMLRYEMNGAVSDMNKLLAATLSWVEANVPKG